MALADARAATAALSIDDRTTLVTEVARDLPATKQRDVVENGIDESVWPQNSKDRRLTILGSLTMAAILFGLTGLFSIAGVAAELITGGLLLASGIVGGIFGYSKAS